MGYYLFFKSVYFNAMSIKATVIFLLYNLFLFIYLFQFGHKACGILVPRLGIKSGPLQWNQGVLTIGPPGKSR